MLKKPVTSKILDIKVEVPDNISPDGARLAEAKGREAAILALQQAGELTIREAAARLGLSCVEYLDLLSEKGLPLSDFEQDSRMLEKLRQQLADKEPPRS